MTIEYFFCLFLFLKDIFLHPVFSVSSDSEREQSLNYLIRFKVPQIFWLASGQYSGIAPMLLSMSLKNTHCC